ncbi:PASTA domain-containing protein [Arcanobacterium hippocoleae]
MPPAIDSLIALFTAKDVQQRPQDARAALNVLEDITAAIAEELMIRRIPVFPAKRTSTLFGTQRITADSNKSGTADTAETAAALPDHDSEPDIFAEQNNISDFQILPTDQLDLRPEENTNSLGTSSTAGTADLSTTSSVPKQPHRQHKRKSRLAILIPVILLLLGLFTAGGYWYFTAGPGLRVTVPAIQSLSQKDAESKLKQAGLKFQLKHAFSDHIAKDLAIGTEPGAGTKIHPSNPVDLIISDGVEQKTVPDVIGKSMAEAISMLQAATFHVETSEDWSEEVPEGAVISQAPAAAELIPHDSNVKIIVSKGRQPITVPNVSGLKIEDAKSALTNLGLKSEVTEEFSDEIEKGTVLKQDTPEGETRYRNDVIKITVSKGPELVAVPNVVGQQEGSAKKR